LDELLDALLDDSEWWNHPHCRRRGAAQPERRGAPYSLSWFSACVGIMSPGPESAQGVGLVLFFPLALVSNAIVPTGGMPSWLQAFANWSPVSTTTAALRDLFGNAKTSAVGDWPARHPVGATVVWALILLSVSTPLAAVMYRKRTTR
jgi:ABC-2 type transport system permease protein